MTDDTPPNQPASRPRRRVLKWLAGLGLVGMGGTVFAHSPRRPNLYYQGPVTDHFDGRLFYNPGGPGPKTLRQLLKWQFGERAQVWPPAFPSPHAGAKPTARLPAGQTAVTFIGHASYLVQTGGLNILFDPVYVERASPVQFAGPKRVNAPGIAFDDLPKIDLLLISHNHYDHLDTATIARVWSRDRPRMIAPLGNDTIIKAAIADVKVEALDWNQRLELAPGVALDCVPTQHWSARGTRDRMQALWASFVVQGPRHTIYIVGDSGFGDGRTFKHVASRHASIDLALLPIGAYEPRWFMRDQHMNPDDAVQAFILSGARRAVGHHWGTFKLTNETVDAPRQDLATALAAHRVEPQRFTALQPGEVVALA
jgi:L-ascorbate metabolism protein UlaG (beta-lactamase superfamily)